MSAESELREAQIAQIAHEHPGEVDDLDVALAAALTRLDTALSYLATARSTLTAAVDEVKSIRARAGRRRDAAERVVAGG